MAVLRVVSNLLAPDPAGDARRLGKLLELDLAMDLGWVCALRAPATPAAVVNVLSHASGGDGSAAG